MTTAVDTRIHLDTYWYEAVAPVIRAIENQYAHYVEADDLAQEAAVWWYGKSAQRHLPEYILEESYTRLRRSLWRVLAKYAEGERGAKVGYAAEDQLRYSTSQIESLLPVAMDPDGLPDGGGVNDLSGIRAHGNLAEGGNVLASLVDVRKGMRALTTAEQSFLHQVQDHHEDWEQLAALERAAGNDIQADSVRRRYDRVLERIARTLNKEEAA